MAISDYYCNSFTTYTKSGSMTSDGTYVYSSVTGSTGKCRIDPVSDNEGDSTHKIFMASRSLDYVDTIYIDGAPYEITGLNIFYNKTLGHHLEIDAKVV